MPRKKAPEEPLEVPVEVKVSSEVKPEVPTEVPIDVDFVPKKSEEKVQKPTSSDKKHEELQEETGQKLSVLSQSSAHSQKWALVVFNINHTQVP